MISLNLKLKMLIKPNKKALIIFLLMKKVFIIIKYLDFTNIFCNKINNKTVKAD